MIKLFIILFAIDYIIPADAIFDSGEDRQGCHRGYAPDNNNLNKKNSKKLLNFFPPWCVKKAFRRIMVKDMLIVAYEIDSHTNNLYWEYIIKLKSGNILFIKSCHSKHDKKLRLTFFFFFKNNTFQMATNVVLWRVRYKDTFTKKATWVCVLTSMLPLRSLMPSLIYHVTRDLIQRHITSTSSS